MVDTRLRDAERRWRSGSVEDGAVVLTERLRLGRIPLLHVQVAAFLGEPAAALVAPSPWPAPVTSNVDAARLQRVPDLGLDEALLREWACRCAERVLPIFEARVPGDPRPRRAVEAARALIRGQLSRDAHRRALVDARAAAESTQIEAARCAARAAVAALSPELRYVLPVYAAHDAQAAATGQKVAHRTEARWQVGALVDLLLGA